MADTLPAVALIVLWSAVFARAPGAWKARQTRSLWVAFAGLAAASTVSWTPLKQVGQLVNVPYLSMLVLHLFAIVAAAGTLDFLAGIQGAGCDARRSYRHAVTAAVMLTVSGLFVVAPRGYQPPGAYDLLTWRPQHPIVVAYGTVFLAYLCFAVAAAAWQTGRYGRRARTRALQVGLCLVSVGCLVGLGYLTMRTVSFLGSAAGLAWLRLEEGGSWAVARVLFAASLLLIVSGSSVPLYPAIRRMSRHYWALQQLYPLWREICGASPHVILHPIPGRMTDALAVPDATARLYRRVVEIRDGALALRGHIAADTYERAYYAAVQAGRPDPEAVAEACWLELGRRAKERALVATTPAESDDNPLWGQSTLDAEVAWLSKVAAAYGASATHRIADALEHADVTSVRAK